VTIAYIIKKADVKPYELHCKLYRTDGSVAISRRRPSDRWQAGGRGENGVMEGKKIEELLAILGDGGEGEEEVCHASIHSR
jgi:hypothetical protein